MKARVDAAAEGIDFGGAVLVIQIRPGVVVLAVNAEHEMSANFGVRAKYQTPATEICIADPPLVIGRIDFSEETVASGKDAPAFSLRLRRDRKRFFSTFAIGQYDFA